MSTSRMVRVVIGTVTFTVPVTLTVLDVFGYVAKVEGVSMQPCLNPETNRCDYVFLNKWTARHHQFERGQVVSLVSPTNAGQRLIKRIIGLEGDTVKTLQYKNRFVKIPEGHCWVEGDHHGHSLDSNLFGPVSVSLIQAKASRIVWPPVRWQPLDIDETYLHRRVNPKIEATPADRLAKCVLAKDKDDIDDQRNQRQRENVEMPEKQKNKNDAYSRNTNNGNTDVIERPKNTESLKNAERDDSPKRRENTGPRMDSAKS